MTVSEQKIRLRGVHGHELTVSDDGVEAGEPNTVLVEVRMGDFVASVRLSPQAFVALGAFMQAVLVSQGRGGR